MLEKQIHITCIRDLFIEWQQSFNEGKQVDNLKELCRIIAQNEDNEQLEKYIHQSKEIMEQMSHAPYHQNYSYNEPSDLDAIRKERVQKAPSLTFSLERETLRDKIHGAWLGRICGCLLGKPVESFHREKIESILKSANNYPLSHYLSFEDIPQEIIQKYSLNPKAFWIDTLNNSAPVDDDTNYTVFALRLIEYFGVDFQPDQVLEAWQSWLPVLWTYTAERIAYRNALLGLKACDTAQFYNPYREWIGAQIRGDFFGYIYPGNCEKAAELAWKDASVSHVKNGIYGEMFVASMLSAAACTKDIQTIIRCGLSQIPQHSRFHAQILQVMQWHELGLSWDDVKNNIHSVYDETNPYEWGHVLPNAMIVVSALLYGNGVFEKSICYAVEAAFDTDCNGATVGSVLGMCCGAAQLPASWANPINDRLATTILDCNNMRISDLVERTMCIIDGLHS